MGRHAFKGTPNRCADCGCVEWHVLEGEINTASERYECMTPGCKCVRWADKIPTGSGYRRINHTWYPVDDEEESTPAPRRRFLGLF